MDEAGKVVGVMGTSIDITARMRDQEAIQESQQRLALLAANLPGIVFLVDPEGVFQLSEGRGLALLGLQPGQVVGLSAYDVYKDIPQICDDLRRCLRGEEFTSAVTVGTLEFETRFVPLLEADGAVHGALGVSLDTTERKRMQEALEKRLVALTQPLEADAAGGIAFEDLFNLADIQRLQDEFSNATGVASIITYPDGKPITRPSNFCRLCIDVIRGSEKGRINCFRSDAALGRYNPDGATIQPCISGGLWDAGAAITLGGKHVANS